MKTTQASKYNLIALVLSLGLIIATLSPLTVSAAGYDSAKYSGGLSLVRLEGDEITRQEYEEIILNDNFKNFVNVSKDTDEYWTQFSTPYYEYQEGMSEEQIELYDMLYATLYGMIDGGSDLDTMERDQYLTPAVTYSNLSDEEAAYVAYCMLYEHPELYYLKTIIRIDDVIDSDIKIIQLGVYEDFATGDSRNQTSLLLKDRIEQLRTMITADTPLEIETQIHDIICDNTVYDKHAAYSQSIASMLLNGESVCAGYSETFSLLCHTYGIDAINVTSLDHEWNQVKLGDYWYVVDVTWDDSSDDISYEYFNKSYKTISDRSAYAESMHTLEETPWEYIGCPECLYDYGTEPDADEQIDPQPTPYPEPEPADLTQDVYRLYNSNTGEHFYTTDYAETMYLSSIGWDYEGVAWASYIDNDKALPVYRMYNPNSTDHFYTLSDEERLTLIDAGWNYEGISFYSDPDMSTPLYRLYNPNAETGSHHYTTDVGESEALVSAGWLYEGISWYVLSRPSH